MAVYDNYACGSLLYITIRTWPFTIYNYTHVAVYDNYARGSLLYITIRTWLFTIYNYTHVAVYDNYACGSLLYRGMIPSRRIFGFIFHVCLFSQ